MDTTDKVEITGSDLAKVAKHVYNLSSPQGLGIIHYEEGELTDTEAKSLVNEEDPCPLRMDYVKGRACKFTVLNSEGRLFIQNRWYDHTDEALNTLLELIRADNGE